MKVIIAVDDSPYSKEVVDSVVKRPWPKNVDFKVLHVLEPLCASCNEIGAAENADAVAEISASRQQAAERLCQKVCHKIESSISGANASYQIREGLPRIEILNAAVDWMADKILVGAHGRDVCPRTLLGSVSRAVASYAPCSVEIVRPQAQYAELLTTS